MVVLTISIKNENKLLKMKSLITIINLISYCAIRCICLSVLIFVYPSACVSIPPLPLYMSVTFSISQCLSVFLAFILFPSLYLSGLTSLITVCLYLHVCNNIITLSPSESVCVGLSFTLLSISVWLLACLSFFCLTNSFHLSTYVLYC